MGPRVPERKRERENERESERIVISWKLRSTFAVSRALFAGIEEKKRS